MNPQKSKLVDFLTKIENTVKWYMVSVKRMIQRRLNMKEDKNNTVFNGNNEDIRSEIKNILEECDKDLSENYIIDSDSEGYSEECRERFRKNEWKRVFSGDLYQKLYTIIFYQNFIKAREAMIHNSCAWQPCIKFFTLTEAQELCDLICPMEMREQINGNIQYNISEIHRPEDIWNIFNWFYTSRSLT